MTDLFTLPFGAFLGLVSVDPPPVRSGLHSGPLSTRPNALGYGEGTWYNTDISRLDYCTGTTWVEGVGGGSGGGGLTLEQIDATFASDAELTAALAAFVVGSDSNSNTKIGTGALSATLTSANYNTAIGHNALQHNATASSNVAIGDYALASMNGPNANTGNIGIGAGAGYALTTGVDNVAIGMSALNSATGVNQNTAVGSNAMYGATGGDNTAIGYEALMMSTGLGNVVVGANANSISGPQAQNVFVGAFAARFAQGTNNVALGFNAFIGPAALGNTGADNVAIGAQALQSITTGSSNTSVGYSANAGLTTVSNTTALGAGTVASVAGAIAIGVDSTGAAATSSTQDLAVIGTSLTTVQVANLSISNPTTQTTAPSAGGAAAIPATPAQYVQVNIAGTNRLIAVY